jgi:pentatricopeptide repeat protein
MESLYAEGNTDLSPDTFTFNIVMKALANCGEKGAARKANLLLQRMEDSFTKGDSILKPDLLSYNTVLDVFSKEGDAKSAERLLQQMLAKDDAMIEPDSHSYTSVLKAFSKSSDDKAEAVRRAEDILNDIESRYASGESDFRPDTSVYNALINCWAKVVKKLLSFGSLKSYP